MASITIHDRADEIRFEIFGRFEGSAVEEVQGRWSATCGSGFWRRITVDISGLSDYDANGRKLLREMYQQGAQFAASTPRSLVFLEQISAPLRQGTIMTLEPRRENLPAKKAAASQGKLPQAGTGSR